MPVTPIMTQDSMVEWVDVFQIMGGFMTSVPGGRPCFVGLRV